MKSISFLIMAFSCIVSCGGMSLRSVGHSADNGTSPVPPSPFNQQLEVKIVPSRTTCIAPCGIFFQVQVIRPGVAQKVEYELHHDWNFDDTLSASWNVDGSPKNTDQGFLTAHVFENPGMFRVELNSRDSVGNTDTAWVNIEVTSRLTNVRTICLNSTFDTNCGPTGLTVWKSNFDAAITELFSANGPANLFISDSYVENINSPLSEGLFISDKTGPYLISTYGSGGSRPILTVFGNNAPGVPGIPDLSDNSDFLLSFSNIQDLTIENIVIRGSYNPLTGLGDNSSGISFFAGAKDVIIRNCTLGERNAGLGTALNIHGGTGPAPSSLASQNIFIIDNTILDWQRVGVSISGVIPGDSMQHFAFIGNHIEQNPALTPAPEACNPMTGICVPNFPDFGPLIISKLGSSVLSHNFFRSVGAEQSTLLEKANIRLGESGDVDQALLASNQFIGGTAMLQQVSLSNAINPGDIVIEKNIFTASSKTAFAIESERGGTLYRNNLIIKPANGGHAGCFSKCFQSAFHMTQLHGAASEVNIDAETLLANNSIISMEPTRAEAVRLLTTDAGSLNRFRVHNNLLYAPEASSVDRAAFSLAIKQIDQVETASGNNLFFFDPRARVDTFAIINSEFYGTIPSYLSLDSWRILTGQDTHTLLSHPLFVDEVNGDFHLQDGSIPVGAGVSIPYVFTDFSGALREGIPNIGAF